MIKTHLHVNNGHEITFVTVMLQGCLIYTLVESIRIWRQSEAKN